VTALKEELEETRGEIHLRGGQERYILIPMRAYAEIVNTMFDLVGQTAGGPLYYLGKKIGRGLVEEMERLLAGRSSLEDVVREYARYLGQLGFGRVEVLGLRGDYAKLRLVNPPSMVGGVARSIGKGGSSGVCHLERGMLAAVLDAMTGAPHVAREVGHGVEPEPYCLVEVAPIRVARAAAVRAAISA